MKVYSLETVDGKHILDGTKDDLRAAVDRIAENKSWGWRPTIQGAEAVCDYVVIAVAIEHA